MRLPRRGLRELVDTVASAMGFAPPRGNRGRKRRTSRRLRLEMLEGRSLLAAGALLQSWHCGSSTGHAQLVSASSPAIAATMVQGHQNHSSSAGALTLSADGVNVSHGHTVAANATTGLCLMAARTYGTQQGASISLIRAANWQPPAPAGSLSLGQVFTPQYFQDYQGGTTGLLTGTTVSQDGTRYGAIMAQGATLTRVGTGTLNLSGGVLIGAGTIDTRQGTWSPGSGMLTGANTYSGNIPVNAGTLQLAGGTTTLGTTTPGTITPGATTLNIGAAGTLVPTIGGVLRFSVATGTGSPVTIGAGVTAMVPSGGTLELAGSVSDLSSPSSAASRVNIVNNNSQTGTGVLVSGTTQQVGAIDSSGTTQLNAGSDLTANHIVQSALIIGGTVTNAGVVTIAAPDSSGNPLAATNGYTLANSLTGNSPFAAATLNSSGLLAASGPSSGGLSL
jgi:hypothetical protein